MSDSSIVETAQVVRLLLKLHEEAVGRPPPASLAKRDRGKSAARLIVAGVADEQSLNAESGSQRHLVLNQNGQELAREILRVVENSLSHRGSSVRVPSWDPDARVLTLGRIIVKKFRRAAPNQELVLCAFEESNWQRRIDDPLRPTRNIVSASRLHETAKSLNRSLQCPLIHFGGDGTGSGICWSRRH